MLLEELGHILAASSCGFHLSLRLVLWLLMGSRDGEWAISDGDIGFSLGSGYGALKGCGISWKLQRTLVLLKNMRYYDTYAKFNVGSNDHSRWEGWELLVSAIRNLAFVIHLLQSVFSGRNVKAVRHVNQRYSLVEKDMLLTFQSPTQRR